ncbi:MAG: hypothetical protein ACKO7Q_11130 [Actinomycetota bacterium]
MTTLRVAIGALALAILLASVLAPDVGISYLLSGPPAVPILLLAFGSIAADALPLQRVPLVCSILTVPLSLMLVVEPVRPLPVVVLATLILGLQALAWWTARRRAEPPRNGSHPRAADAAP